MRKYIERFVLFAILNLSIIWSLLFLFFSFDGFETDGTQRLLVICMMTSFSAVTVVSVANRWWKKGLCFYLSMLSFLLLTGLVLSWDEKVGSHAVGSWIARMDGTLRLGILGQPYGIPLLPLVVLVNWLNCEHIFEVPGTISRKMPADLFYQVLSDKTNSGVARMLAAFLLKDAASLEEAHVRALLVASEDENPIVARAATRAVRETEQLDVRTLQIIFRRVLTSKRLG